MRYKSKALLVQKWTKLAGFKFVSHMASANTWKSIQDIRHDIGDYAGLQFDYSTVADVVEREWIDTVYNPSEYRRQRKHREQHKRHG